MSAQRRNLELGNVLVVGGCGFLGWHIVDHLLNFPSETDPSSALPKPQGDGRFEYPTLGSRYPQYKATVSVVDLRTTHNRLPGATYYDGDITSVESMMKVFNAVKPDLVIHTATPSVLDGNKKLLHKVNVEGTRTLLQVAGGEHGDWGGRCKAFVYTSSSSVVHDTQSDLKNVNEEWPLIRGRMQKEYYSETKVSIAALRRHESKPGRLLTHTPPTIGRRRRDRPEVQPPVPHKHGDLRHPTRRHLRREGHDSDIQDPRTRLASFPNRPEDATR